MATEQLCWVAGFYRCAQRNGTACKHGSAGCCGRQRPCSPSIKDASSATCQLHLLPAPPIGAGLWVPIGRTLCFMRLQPIVCPRAPAGERQFKPHLQSPVPLRPPWRPSPGPRPSPWQQSPWRLCAPPWSSHQHPSAPSSSPATSPGGMKGCGGDEQVERGSVKGQGLQESGVREYAVMSSGCVGERTWGRLV